MSSPTARISPGARSGGSRRRACPHRSRGCASSRSAGCTTSRRCGGCSCSSSRPPASSGESPFASPCPAPARRRSTPAIDETLGALERHAQTHEHVEAHKDDLREGHPLAEVAAALFAAPKAHREKPAFPEDALRAFSTASAREEADRLALEAREAVASGVPPERVVIAYRDLARGGRVGVRGARGARGPRADPPGRAAALDRGRAGRARSPAARRRRLPRRADGPAPLEPVPAAGPAPGEVLAR